MNSLKKLFKALAPTEIPYVLIVGQDAEFEKHRALLQHGVYWVKRVNVRKSGTLEAKLYPLRKSRMCRTPHELVEAFPYHHQGQLIEKSWAPMSQQLLAWYDMLPDVEQSNHSGDSTYSNPQMPG